MWFFDLVDVGSISASKVVKAWDVSGYTQVNFRVWAQGPANGKLQVTVYFNNLTGFDETFNFNSYGNGLLIRTSPVYGPSMSMVLYNPSGTMNVKVTVYASCCGSNALTLKWPLAFGTNGMKLQWPISRSGGVKAIPIPTNLEQPMPSEQDNSS